MSRRDIRLSILLLTWIVVGRCVSSAEAQIRAMPPNRARSQASAPMVVVEDPADFHPESGEFVELDARSDPSVLLSAPAYQPAYQPAYADCWNWQVLPQRLLYKSYMVDTSEPRLASVWFYDQGQGWMWDLAVGARLGILRYGSRDDRSPEGWQLDAEGGAFPRLALERDRDLVSTDFVFGLPLTWRRGKWEAELSYFHLSSHLGDEFQESFPQATRINYVWDGVLLGAGFRPHPSVRLYTEAGWAFYTRGGAGTWKFQFGFEFSPARATGIHGAPFFAVGGQIREELDFGGNLALQTGWQWRNDSGRVFRAGLHYFNGKSSQMQFFNRFEQQIGLGAWYDY